MVEGLRKLILCVEASYGLQYRSTYVVSSTQVSHLWTNKYCMCTGNMIVLFNNVDHLTTPHVCEFK